MDRKYGLWKMRSIEKWGVGRKYGVWKMGKWGMGWKKKFKKKSYKNL